MVGRQPISPGTWGQVVVRKTPAGTFQAETRYRTFSGEYRKLRARGTSASAARSGLAQRLRELSEADGVDSEITGRSTVADLASFWLAEKEAEGASPNTLATYRSTVRNQILPVIGYRNLQECRTAVVDRVVKDQAARGMSTQLLRKCLNQMFGLAVRHDALSANPVRDVTRLARRARGRSAIRYLTLDQVAEVRDLIDERMAEPRRGPRISGDLRDMVDMILATGCRIGEVLALTWPLVDLAESIPT